MTTFNNLPVPLPPRTPTPPTPLPEEPFVDDDGYDQNSLTPTPSRLSWTSADFQGINIQASSTPPQTPSYSYAPSPTRFNGTPTFSPIRQSRMNGYSNGGSNSSTTTLTTTVNGTSTPPTRSPFNFKQVVMAPPTNPGSMNQQANQRRGHRYKRSSMSHQIFTEPKPRAPLAVPLSLPIPTIKEWRQSMTKEQKIRLGWGFVHFGIAVFCAWKGHGSLAMTALSHLVIYDAVSAALCVVVDVLSNFDVWSRSSIRHPFGLQRAEVLIGFAMSVLLLFMGFDLIQHAAQDLVAGLQGDEDHEGHGHSHGGHGHHRHQRVPNGTIDTHALLVIGATLVSGIGLKNHVRIGKALRFAYISNLPSILSNPSHFLTLSCSGLLFLLPLLSVTMYAWVDRTLSLTIAVSMIMLGLRLVKILGSMLLMRYGGEGVPEVIKAIEQDSAVTTIEEASFWQVHYSLCMANLKLHVHLSDASTEVKIRERISRLIKDRLGGVYGRGKRTWDVTIEIVPSS
ncbi:Endoplasmic reticulum zinc transporter [Orbilia oligospora]|uniref:Zinc transporter n=2 Tax=Orbilia oligospora TaxID=2813651 RepID=A0A7C8IWW8_ORBOL|nr:Endoplasmic reticulum zinc transporter [Orbilia oligospora]KAF3094933.1 Endoplasmic reticulum zinc transporter [Orbilia oligospora]KAF3099325.1 Endoplasmic reticulum zinc transporter [Orbilia oligospora]KAF3137628.1 Endoplasmic reticulum zinc transporter [Orbilia oligospora]KAF3151171.1 Endoplasmic reticulum zinc transporter [Orbilia oligospora]